MPKTNDDLNENAPDNSGAALIIIDMINDLEFPGGERILEPALKAAQHIARLKDRAKKAGIPVIFANDNFGRWRSNFRDAVAHCLHDGVRGRALVEWLQPDEDDYFVLKPKHSAFYATPLELLLHHLQCNTVILTGISGNMCVQFTANDAYMRDFEIYAPCDCIASYTSDQNQDCLEYMRTALKAKVDPSDMLDLKNLDREVD